MKEGELYKRGSPTVLYFENIGHVAKNWKLRWFILEADKLYYLKSKPPSDQQTKIPDKPQGIVFLLNCRVVLADTPSSEIQEHPPTNFSPEKEGFNFYVEVMNPLWIMDTM